MVLQLVLVTSGYSGAQCCCYLIVQGGISGRLEPGVVLVACIRSSSHKSEASQKDRETDSCLPWSNKSASLTFSYPNELRIHHTSGRKVASAGAAAILGVNKHSEG